MSKGINPSPKPEQARTQQTQRQRGRSSAQSASSSSQNITTTAGAGVQRRQVDRNQQATESDQELDFKDRNLVYAHRAMRRGLSSFTGVTHEPEPDPATGSYSRTLNYNTAVQLENEIAESANKLYRATFPEKEKMIDNFDTLPELLSYLPKKKKEWARVNTPPLYREYIEAAFDDFTRMCVELGTEEAKDVAETRGKLLYVASKICRRYREERQ